MVSVSAIEVAVFDVTGAFLSVVTLLLVAMVLVLILVIGRWDLLAWHPVPSVRPSRQVVVAAPFAAERTPARVYRTHAAHDA
jgi:hypothetical protein